MTDEAALIAAVLKFPVEDTPRLVYADKLDELAGTVECGACKGNGHFNANTHEDFRAWGMNCSRCSGTGRVSDGRRERAEFIRVGVELARIGNLEWWECEGNLCCGPRGHVNCRLADLRHRERALLEQSWAGNLDLGFGGGPWTDLVWTRGFVSALVCTWDAWRTHAAAILAAQPVERVRLTTWPGDDTGPVRTIALSVDGSYEEVEMQRWPRITFELPAGPTIRIAPNITWTSNAPGASPFVTLEPRDETELPPGYPEPPPDGRHVLTMRDGVMRWVPEESI